MAAVFKVLVLMLIFVCMYCKIIVLPDGGSKNAGSDESLHLSCFTLTGQPGECTLPESCYENELIYDAEIRAELHPCPDYHVCCPKYQSSQPSQSEDEKRLSDLPKCGTSYPADDGVDMRIIGSQFFEKTRLAQYPWMAAIFTLKRGKQVYLCGGSLIHPRVVLTAAHCLSGLVRYHGLKVRVGDWDLVAEEEVPAHQERVPDNIVVHHGFHRNKMSYDVALIIVKGAYDINQNVGFVCLPAVGMGSPRSAPCRVTGWGWTGYMTHKSETVLRMIEIPIVSKAKCEKELQRMLRKNFVLDRTSMCAGGVSGQDACAGDSGSPLICYSENGYVQYGIVSWGVKCGLPGVPGVYTNVSTVKDWIDKEMKTWGFSPSSYTQP